MALNGLVSVMCIADDMIVWTGDDMQRPTEDHVRIAAQMSKDMHVSQTEEMPVSYH